MRWTVHPTAPVRCGACPTLIAPGEPIALLLAGRVRQGAPFGLDGLPRCVACAGAPVDAAQLDAERLRLEAAAIPSGAPTPADPRPDYRHMPAPARRRQMTAAAALADAFDYKAAAGGDYDR